MVRFDFLFDFKFGAQEVSVEMLRAPDAERFYLFVNRLSFGPAREGIARSALAPRRDARLGHRVAAARLEPLETLRLG